MNDVIVEQSRGKNSENIQNNDMSNNVIIDDLLNNKRTWYINYYSLVKYTIDKYGIEYLKELITKPSIQKKETIKLFNELLEVLECMN